MSSNLNYYIKCSNYGSLAEIEEIASLLFVLLQNLKRFKLSKLTSVSMLPNLLQGWGWGH
jgi:hypothetical protein